MIIWKSSFGCLELGASLKHVMATHPPSPASGLSEHAAFYSERLDAELDRFNAESRKAVWRSGIYAVLGAIVVVGIGIWGFGVETNTRNAPARHIPAAPPPGSTVMVVIKPGGSL